MKKQCDYWDVCKQVKEFEACIHGQRGCIIYARFKTLDRNKPKTGLERFVARYPNWEMLGIGATTEAPAEYEGEYKN